MCFIAAVVALAVVHVHHQLPPRRIVWPALAGGGVLLLLAAAAASDWDASLRAALASVVLLVLHPGVTGLYLDWISWQAVVSGRWVSSCCRRCWPCRCCSPAARTGMPGCPSGRRCWPRPR